MIFKEYPIKNTFTAGAYTLFGACILAFLAYFINYHYHIISCPYPLEYREGAQILPTALLLEGKNPFDYANNPQFTNVYGIFNNLLLYPAAKIWGPTLLLHRIAAGFFLIASCLIIINVLRKDGLPWLFSCAAGVLLYPFLLFPDSSTPLAGPHTLGLLLFLTTFFLPYFFNYSPVSLGISLLTGTLAFYTKQYFLLGVPLTASYIFLFKSKKIGVFYGGAFAVFFMLTVLAVNRMMNCYFNNVFYAAHNMVQIPPPPSVEHAIEQLLFFYKLQKPLFLLMALCLLAQAVVFVKNFKKVSWSKAIANINFLNWQAPLLKWNFNINLYGLIISTMVIYFELGRNYGQFMPYLYQLMSPFFVLYLFNGLYKQRWTVFVGLGLIVFNLWTLSSHFPKNFHEYDENWKSVDKLIDASGNIFASPMLVPLLVEHRRQVYDSGQSEYFQYGENRNLLGFKFPSQPLVSQRVDDYSRRIWDMLSQKKFGFIIIFANYHPFLASYYPLFYRPVGSVLLNGFHSPGEHNEFIVLVPR